MNRVKFCEQGRYCQVFCVLCIAVLFALPTGALAQTGLFFSDFAHTYIGSVGVDGTGIQNLFGPNDLGTPLNQPNDIAIDSDAGFIFFASGTTSGVIGVASLDGSGTPSTLVSGVSSPRSLVVDSTNQRLYWIDSDINNNSEGIVKRCSSASGNGCEASTETVFSGINSANPTSIALDVAGDRIFISDNSGAQRIIQSASMAGGLPLSASDFTTIVSQANVNIRGMHYDARFDRIHWCQNSGLLGIFQRAADGSGNITSTVTSTNLGQSCDDIVIDSENSIAFWTGLDDSSDPAIQSINLDGSNRTILVGETSNPDTGDYAEFSGLAFVAESAPRAATPDIVPEAPVVESVVGNTVTLELEEFDGASLSNSSAVRLGPTLRDFGLSDFALAKALSIRYETIANRDGLEEVARRKFSKKNTVTFKNLASGTYTFKTRVRIGRKKTRAQRQKAKARGKKGLARKFKTRKRTEFSPSSSEVTVE